MDSFFPYVLATHLGQEKILQSQTHLWQNNILDLGMAVSLKNQESFVIESIISIHTMKYYTRMRKNRL